MGAVASCTKKIGELFYKKNNLSIVMLGLGCAGKSTILHKLALGEVEFSMPTLGMNIESSSVARHGSSVVSLTSHDVGGRSLSQPFLRRTYRALKPHAVVFVVDSTDNFFIELASFELQRLLDIEELNQLPLLVLANKQDPPAAMPVEVVVDKLKLHGLRNRAWCIFGTVATTEEGLFEAFDWLYKSVDQRKSGVWKPSSSSEIEVAMPVQKPKEGSETKDDLSTADTEDMQGRADVISEISTN
eukprot:TRINITY_DN1413_c0_g1_i1.p1 TRINITY_DN1413_c0_g1~~TRINITY_DN1413_c0_g1_i1.p1  ORF type:complete len:244 (-),score=39.84 TRINITY_DN1413_c0_g1_i1:176-907(-)